jgi:hypothetical protein
MADAPVVHIGENSPEQVAFKLYNHVRGMNDAERKKALELYGECLMAVKQPGDFAPGYK